MIHSSKEDAIKSIFSETKDGVHVIIEAVGIPATFDVCQQIVRPGGMIFPASDIPWILILPSVPDY